MAPILKTKGIQLRMNCSPQMARRIQDVFVSVDQLRDACISNDEKPLDYDGIAGVTAGVIADWWEHRYAREKQIPEHTVEGATIYIHTDWSETLREVEE
jgi:hypothetical protein